MSAYLTLQQICTKLQTALLHSRTDFLLMQTQLWQEINNTGKDSNAFVKPSNLDLSLTKFEFYIAPKNQGIITHFFYSIFRIPQRKSRFKLCNKNCNKSVKVIIEISLQSSQQLKAEITTEPKNNLKPEEIYVTGLSV
jgi:hypothetical protein